MVWGGLRFFEPNLWESHYLLTIGLDLDFLIKTFLSPTPPPPHHHPLKIQDGSLLIPTDSYLTI